MEDVYFLELASDPCHFDKVGQKIAMNKKFVVNPDGTSRYTDNFVRLANGEMHIHFSGKTTDMGIITRMLGVSIPNGVIGLVPIVNEPTHLTIIKGRSHSMIELATGAIYKKVA